ncbi:hypothetical protein BD779DRAFT_1680126 [Infundibulicybe gibba]|nr:hypothetical protein BD779DRAFT_1680126 [Infundibulicybe gibba]
MKFLIVLAAIGCADAYWLMGITNIITTQRLDPIVNPGSHSSHVHEVVGGSNFGRSVNTELLRKSECTSIPIAEDKSNYWTPATYFHWANGSVSHVGGGFVIVIADYLFDNKPGVTTAFPDDFRMISGNAMARALNESNHEQQAVSFLCLNYGGKTTRHADFPEKSCPSGIRMQINFQSCWDGKNVDSPNHKSHVAYRSEGPDRGSCNDPRFPLTLPRIFMEFYLDSGRWEKYRSQAKNPRQPFVLSNGEQQDFFNGWAPGVLQKAVDGCNCNIYGDAKCCAEKGIFTLTKDKKCFITPTIEEQVLGTLPKLPGSNPIQTRPEPIIVPELATPGILSPVPVVICAIKFVISEANANKSKLPVGQLLTSRAFISQLFIY